ncbi:MAG: hypothetical protein MZV63_43980 [Marinilabiliales bacterium]|nr:hypothetical protein [Marinilabiliales bacterium]
MRGKPISKATGKSCDWVSLSEHGTWQLYDLEKDPGEINDLSQQFPAKRDSLINDWMKYAEENGVIDHKGFYDAFLQKSISGNH